MVLVSHRTGLQRVLPHRPCCAALCVQAERHQDLPDLTTLTRGFDDFKGRSPPWQLNISCFEEPQKGFELDPWFQATGLWVSESRQNPSLDLPAFRA